MNVWWLFSVQFSGMGFIGKALRCVFRKDREKQRMVSWKGLCGASLHSNARLPSASLLYTALCLMLLAAAKDSKLYLW